MSGSARIVRGNALALPLEDSSVDLIVTSPPYFGLRSYQDGGEHYAGQIGSEATPAEFVDALIAATREMVRVLKPSGSIWVNLGDKYSSGNGGQSNLTALGERLGTGGGQKADVAKQRTPAVAGMKPKSLIGVPWRYALRCIDDLGLILRAEVIWSKPNGLPESVTDRVRRSHEQWFHMVKEPRYFSAVDEIREEHVATETGRDTSRWRTGPPNNRGLALDQTAKQAGEFAVSPLGKLPGSVWTVPTQPLRVPESLGVDHFAAFPMEWPRRIIRGWSPSGVCTVCGEGRRPVTERTPLVVTPSPRRSQQLTDTSLYHQRTATAGTMTQAPSSTITGYTCSCLEDSCAGTSGEPSTAIGGSPTGAATNAALPATRPAVVLDPFGGTGTTALVAKALGRHGISVDMSADYCRLATWRTNDPDELARALQVDKPARQVDGQADLFDLIEGAAS